MGRIASVEELVDYIGVISPTLQRGTVLNLMLEGAEDFVTTFTGRQFWAEPDTDDDDPVTKTFTQRPGFATLRVPDLRSIVTITSDGVELQPGINYDLPDTYQEPSNYVKILTGSALGITSPFTTQLYSTIVITGFWGFTSVPGAIKDATLALASRRYHERKASWSDSTQTPEGGVFNYFRAMPESIRQALLQYRTPNFAMVSDYTSPTVSLGVPNYATSGFNY